jgi:hypothetical protein
MSRPGEARWPPPVMISVYRTPLGSTTSCASFTSWGTQILGCQESIQTEQIMTTTSL